MLRPRWPLVDQKPELRAKEPFKTVLSGDREAIAKLSMQEIFEIVLLTQSGMTVEDYRADVRQWLATARHPRWNRPYTDLVYQPMLELLSLLRANGFTNFIATGGSGGFVREYSGKVYDIPPERVSGTGQADAFGYDKDGKPILTYDPEFVLNNIEAAKIENFWLTYGRRLRLAFGNSSSADQQMLEYVKAGPGARLSAQCCTTTRRENTPTALLKDCRIQASALSVRRCTTWRSAALDHREHEKQLGTVVSIRIVAATPIGRSVMKPPVTVLEPKLHYIVRLAAVLLCCLCAFAFGGASRAQISPFFNRFSGTLNEEDVKDLMAAGQRLYGQDVVPDGATDTWSNPKTGNSGTITVLQSFTREGMQCRKVRYNNRIRNQPDTRIYTLDWCKTPQGVWKIA